MESTTEQAPESTNNSNSNSNKRSFDDCNQPALEKEEGEATEAIHTSRPTTPTDSPVPNTCPKRTKLVRAPRITEVQAQAVALATETDPGRSGVHTLFYLVNNYMDPHSIQDDVFIATSKPLPQGLNALFSFLRQGMDPHSQMNEDFFVGASSLLDCCLTPTGNGENTASVDELLALLAETPEAKHLTLTLTPQDLVQWDRTIAIANVPLYTEKYHTRVIVLAEYEL